MDKTFANNRDMSMVCEIVSAFFDIRLRDLPLARYVVARDVAIYFARFGASVPAAHVAERFNMKPAAIRRALDAIDLRKASDPAFDAILRRIERLIYLMMEKCQAA